MNLVLNIDLIIAKNYLYAENELSISSSFKL